MVVARRGRVDGPFEQSRLVCAGGGDEERGNGDGEEISWNAIVSDSVRPNSKKDLGGF